MPSLTFAHIHANVIIIILYRNVSETIANPSLRRNDHVLFDFILFIRFYLSALMLLRFLSSHPKNMCLIPN